MQNCVMLKSLVDTLSFIACTMCKLHSVEKPKKRVVNIRQLEDTSHNFPLESDLWDFFEPASPGRFLIFNKTVVYWPRFRRNQDSQTSQGGNPPLPKETVTQHLPANPLTLRHPSFSLSVKKILACKAHRDHLNLSETKTNASLLYITNLYN